MSNCPECNGELQFIDRSGDGDNYYLCSFCHNMFRQNESEVEEVKRVCIRDPHLN